MKMQEVFSVAASRDEAVAAISNDEALVSLFPDAKVELTASDGNRRTVRILYTALGAEGVAVFHFTFESNGDVSFEKVCDGRMWKQLSGRVSFLEDGEDCEVRIEMNGKTKALIPEITIKLPMREQVSQMRDALSERIEGV